MSTAYVIGQITVKDPERWAEYRARVPQTLAPWGAELVFRGRLAGVLAGDCPHSDIVVIRFPDRTAIEAWYASPAYQALLPLRRAAADMDLLTYDTI
ncbi:MAG: DUF1330 domain-containing protein [Rhodocyclaceae bacterium]|jgi:uncharacterized protein (DUF1330 family)|nr:DUF1330 domain-containing protein [Rhodocyclaceae bacterium]